MGLCTHCDEEILVPIFNTEDLKKAEPFCCNGCLTVFNVLHQKGLESYYDIKNQSSIFKRRSPVSIKEQKYLYLDDPEFIKEYSYKNLAGENTIEFYLEGIHCLACLWLIEKLPEFLADVTNARLDMNKSVATVSIKADGKFSSIARELNNLGYRPHALKRNQDVFLLKQKEERRMLLKIGIAGAAAGNIMIYAVSIYAGADGHYLRLFNSLTVFLALPVFLYSATPFYQNAWNAIKTRTLSIDIPIAMSLIIGAIFGIYCQIVGINENFFDSLTALVFLLLLSRYFLNKIQEEGLKASDLTFFYQGASVLKKVDAEFVEVHPQYLKEGDLVKVKSNEIIPVDGVIVDGASSLNNSLLTGESCAIKADIGTHVFSGTMNIDNELIIRVEKTDQETRIGKILKQIENGWIQKAKIVELTNRISKYFIIVVLLLATVLFVKFMLAGQTKIAIDRALTLLIITCPCASALATPLTLTRTLSRASKKGIIIKNDEVIEKISKIDSVYLDKTGTVTYGQLKVDHFEVTSASLISVYDVITNLERLSLHPVATALKEYALGLSTYKTYEVIDYREILGVGVQGSIEGHFYQIKEGKIFEDGNVIATFSLNDIVRPDSKKAVDLIKEYGIKVSMVSGDRKEIVENISKQIGLDQDLIQSEVSPEAKLSVLEKTDKALMVGDGANDAMALGKAFVGVAVHGAMDISLRAADIYLATPGITPVSDLVVISKETMKVIYRNLVISLIYNLVSVYLVFTGAISPLIAAIIMPISSLTVLVSTLIGTKKLNQRLKEV